MNLQGRLEVQGTVQQWIASFMQQYGVPASIMIDALNKVLASLKDELILELFAEAAQMMQQEQQQAQPQEEPVPNFSISEDKDEQSDN